ncbi:MAG: DSBA oxidoreductase [Microgenomates group bacterium GW2011_GWD1_33_9]|nr:MAG: DSBA oxidoreductase [Microgenomates group bacterium GW2011_GWD1_33_9]
MSENVEKKSSLKVTKPSLLEKFVPALLVITVGLAFLVGVLWQKVENIGKGNTNTTTGTQQQAPEPVKVSPDQIKGLFDKDVIKFGNKDSKVLFVEASDPSCPYCHIAAGLNPELNTQVGPQFKLVSDGGTYIAPVIEMKKLVDSGKASFVWLYFNGHGNGEMGTKAMYCAYEKGKFWEVHDVFFNNQKLMEAGDTAGLKKLAADNGVDSGKLEACLAANKYDAKLAKDTQLGQAAGVGGTPSFAINGQLVEGAVSFGTIQVIIEKALR